MRVPLVLVVLLIAQSAGAQSRVRWSRDSPEASSFYFEGVFYEVIKTDNVWVRVTTQDTGWKMRADVRVLNRGNRPIDVRPDEFSLLVMEKPSSSPKPMAYEDPVRLAASVERRARRGAAIGNVLASVPQEQITRSYESGTVNGTVNGQWVDGTYQGTRTIRTWGPDYEAQRRAAERGNQAIARASTIAEQIRAGTLKAHTLGPGDEISGAVFFARPRHIAAALLTVSMEGQQFEFPFGWKKRR